MQLSLHADYSCRVLMHLALRAPARTSIADISATFGISQNHLTKVVHRLGKLGFIETIRGRGGGLKLKLAPEAIVIGDVIRRTEPTWALQECFSVDRNRCPIAGGCGLKTALTEALDAFHATLDRVTLADIIRNKSSLTAALKLPLPVETAL